MLRPIPSRILRSTAEVRVCTGADLYQNQAFEGFTVEHVHLQPTDRIVKGTGNTDHQLTSILFADARHSTAFDWRGAFDSAHLRGGDVFVTVRGVEYTVLSVDALYDDSDRFHHWEIGLG